jgi:hypothetical protein
MKAIEIVILTWRTLRLQRVAMSCRIVLGV